MCPICRLGDLELRVSEYGKEVGDTFGMWVCDECPIIMFEYYDDKSIEKLKANIK